MTKCELKFRNVEGLPTLDEQEEDNSFSVALRPLCYDRKRESLSKEGHFDHGNQRPRTEGY